MGRREVAAGVALAAVVALEGRQPPKTAMIEQLTSSSTFYEVEYCTVCVYSLVASTRSQAEVGIT